MYPVRVTVRALARTGLTAPGVSGAVAASGEMDDVRASYGSYFAGLSQDQYFAAFALLMAGMAAALMADTALARTRAAESVELFTEIGGRRGAGYACCVQVAIDALAARTAAELGAAATPQREAGRAAGRGDRIAAALGLTPEPSALRRQQQELPLTRRENEITQLIATGLTNRQIAERLFIAQRTVDTHVGHILAKLGCRNRSQAAALIGALRPPAPT